MKEAKKEHTSKSVGDGYEATPFEERYEVGAKGKLDPDAISRKDGGKGRAYPGYEDPSPEGRAAIKAYNDAGGPSTSNYVTRAKALGASRDAFNKARKK